MYQLYKFGPVVFWPSGHVVENDCLSYALSEDVVFVKMQQMFA